MQTIAFILIFFLIGYFVKSWLKDVDTTVKWINNYIVYIALPSIVLIKIPALSFSWETLLPPTFAWVWALIGSLLVLAFSRTLQFSKQVEGASILLVILGNVSYLGYPMILAFFNDAVLGYAIFYDQLGNFLIFCTAGLITIAVYSPNNSDQRVSSGSIAFKIISFPPFVALILALLLPLQSFTSLTEPLLSAFGQSLMPLALVVIGLQFQPQLQPEHRQPLIVAMGLKLMLAPLLAFGFSQLVTNNQELSQAIIFEAAMPCMITPGILAIQAGIAPRFTASLLGYSTLLSFVSLPLIAWLIA